MPPRAPPRLPDDLHSLLMEMANEAVVVHADDRIELANASAALLLGLASPDDLVGMRASEFFPTPAKAPRAYPRRRSVERSVRRADGVEQTVLWCERTCSYRGRTAVQAVFRAPAPSAVDALLPDQLTELPGRRHFRTHLQGAIDRAIRNRHLVWVLYVDLDRFAAVNASHGHAFGDRVLAEAAVRLQQCIRRTDFLASAGGDEFLIALEGTTDLEGARVVAARALQALTAPFASDGIEARLGACIGLSAGPTDGSASDALLRNVDIALAQAKAAGRGRLEVYSEEMDDRQRRSALAREDTERKLASLTPREQEVLDRLVAGEANKMIAYMLGASMRTIEHHRARIMDKMAAGSLPELVRMVIGRNDA